MADEDDIHKALRFLQDLSSDESASTTPAMKLLERLGLNRWGKARANLSAGGRRAVREALKKIARPKGVQTAWVEPASHDLRDGCWRVSWTRVPGLVYEVRFSGNH